jgi:hypothetical protein
MFDTVLIDFIKNLFLKYDDNICEFSHKSENSSNIHASTKLENIKFYKGDNILNYFKQNEKFLHMSLNKIDDLYILKSDNLSENLYHTDKDLNLIIHKLDYFIFDKTFDFKLIIKKKIKIDKPYNVPIVEEIKNNWQDIKIYNYNIGLNTCIIYYNDELYYVDKNNFPYILKCNNNKYISQIIEKSNIDFKNNIITKIIISSQKIGHILYYKNNVICEDIFLEKNDNIFYSCFDELIFDLEYISNINEQRKKLTIGGFIISYKDDDYVINTYIYQKIQDIIPFFKNINKCYLELYKNDNLSFVINFMSTYPSDIIKRVNLSIKTLSREFLNIYHVTRKKSNSDLYNILSNNYKTILYDLHKIFIYTRKNEEGISDEEFYEKKSLNHDIIYKYLKKINIDLLVNIFIDRLILLNDIQGITIDMNNIRMNTTEFKILFADCIHTKTMAFLLKL